jgi:ATP-dependent Clp protease protease subunit
MPRREGPLLVPLVDVPGDRPATERGPRRVLLSGPLDAPTTNRVAAELMELDGRAADEVELLINSDGGRLADVLPLLDVLGLMRAPVRTRCVGRATGTAAILLACGTGGRQAARHALVSLRCTDQERIEGGPEVLRAQLEELDLVRRHVIDALAAATGRPRAELADDLDRGGVLDAAGAAALGVVDQADS